MNANAAWLGTQSRARASGDEKLDALFVLNSLNVGGSETKTVRIVNGLLPLGIRAGIAYLNEPEPLRQSLDPEVPAWNLQRRGKVSIAALQRLRALIRLSRPHSVLSVNLYPSLYVALATAAMPKRPRTIALLNTTTLPQGEQWRQSFYGPFLRRMDRIVYGCGVQQTEWSPRLNTDPQRCAVIYNGVDTEHFAPGLPLSGNEARERFNIPARAFVIGTIGRLEREKNQDALLTCAAELRGRSVDAHVLLVGEGRRHAELERRAAQLSLSSHVTFAGVQRDVRPLLSCMDAFVLPSTHIETFSNAALEAMAMARPVVLSRVGGASEMIRDGVEGYTLATAHLGTELPQLLQRLHANPKLRDQLGRAARERAVATFSAQAMIQHFAALIADRNSDRQVA